MIITMLPQTDRKPSRLAMPAHRSTSVACVPAVIGVDVNGTDVRDRAASATGGDQGFVPGTPAWSPPTS